jgi:hypothetical protein
MRDLPRIAPEWPLVGRKAELDLALAELDAGRRGVVIAGPAGVGRTRLAREISRSAEAHGRPIAWVAGDTHDARRRAAIGLPRGVALVLDDAHRLAAPLAGRLLDLAHESDAFLVVTLESGARCCAALRALWKEAQVPRIDLAPIGETGLAE